MIDETATPETAGTTDPKEKSEGSERTDALKVRLAERFGPAIGKPCSKDLAWKLFKIAIHSAFGATLDLPRGAQKLSLSGVGTFEVIEAKARNEAETKLGFAPRARFYPSSAIQRRVEVFYGIATMPEGQDATPAEDKVPEAKAVVAKPAPAAKPKPAAAAKATPAAKTKATPSASTADIDTSDLDLDPTDSETTGSVDEIDIDETDI